MSRLTGALAALGAGVAAGGLYWRRHPSACPYGARFSLDLLRPGLGAGRLHDALVPRPGEHILEVGPGTGHYTLPVAEWIGPGGRLDAFDVQPEMLRQVERRATARGLSNVVTREGDARSLPYDDGTFDAVFMVTVLGEIPDQDAALREVARVLRPGGRAVFGEIVVDPHVVTTGALRARAEAAGLRWGARHGGPLAFFARLEKRPEG
jgi:ubiquinone/menaquinone biosynthesis C-methylase UbiE